LRRVDEESRLCLAARNMILPAAFLLSFLRLPQPWPASSRLAVRRSPSPAAAAASAAAASAAEPTAEAAVFSDLLAAHGLATDSVALRSDGPGGRTLVAARDLGSDEVALAVPRRLLLTAHRSGAIGGLAGQTDLVWDAAGDLREEVGEAMFKRGATWDVRLALAVLEATAGCGGELWDAYRRFLPLPHELSSPVCLPAELLAELREPAVASAAAARNELLADLYAPLMAHEAHPATAGYVARGGEAARGLVPAPLSWAYALVSSRCFALSGGDTFGFVPFLDMCQHSAVPSANFTSDERGIVLRTLRPVAAGEEVTISYGGDYSSRRTFEQYGFVLSEGCAADATLLEEAVAAAAAAGSLSPADVMRDASAAEPPTEAAFRAACVSARAATGDDLATDERFTALHQAPAEP